jgi:hypothetical protein
MVAIIPERGLGVIGRKEHYHLNKRDIPGSSGNMFAVDIATRNGTGAPRLPVRTQDAIGRADRQ